MNHALGLHVQESHHSRIGRRPFHLSTFSFGCRNILQIYFVPFFVITYQFKSIYFNFGLHRLYLLTRLLSVYFTTLSLLNIFKLSGSNMALNKCIKIQLLINIYLLII